MTPEEQRTQALKRANQIREHRAVLKRQMAAGEAKLSDVLRAEDELLATMRVADLLRAVPGFGKTKARRILERLKLSPSVTVERLYARRREELLSRISEVYPCMKGRI